VAVHLSFFSDALGHSPSWAFSLGILLASTATLVLDPLLAVGFALPGEPAGGASALPTDACSTSCYSTSLDFAWAAEAGESLPAVESTLLFG